MVNQINRRAAITQSPEPGRLKDVLPAAPRGQIAMLSDYIDPGQTFVTSPNQDVVYGLGFLSLDEEPVVVQVPNFNDRFWVFPTWFSLPSMHRTHKRDHDRGLELNYTRILFLLWRWRPVSCCQHAVRECYQASASGGKQSRYAPGRRKKPRACQDNRIHYVFAFSRHFIATNLSRTSAVPPREVEIVSSIWTAVVGCCSQSTITRSKQRNDRAITTTGRQPGHAVFREWAARSRL
jgi:hypothetical protein